MQELIYCLSYVLEHMDLMGRHRGSDGRCMCNLCCEDCESVHHLFRAQCIIFRAFKKDYIGKEFESCDAIYGEILFHSGDRALGEPL